MPKPSSHALYMEEYGERLARVQRDLRRSPAPELSPRTQTAITAAAVLAFIIVFFL